MKQYFIYWDDYPTFSDSLDEEETTKNKKSETFSDSLDDEGWRNQKFVIYLYNNKGGDSSVG